MQIADADGKAAKHTLEFISDFFDQELARIIRELPAGADDETAQKFRQARRVSEEMIARGQSDPV